jgi:hypothetical protein
VSDLPRARWGSGEHGRASTIVVLVVLAVFAAGIAVWWSETHRERAMPVATPDAPAGSVQRALENAEPDSSEIKIRWVEDVPGIDLAALTEPRREVFVRFVNARSCTCGCGYTLGACRNFDPTCEVSGPLVEALFDSVKAGRIERVPAGLRERPAAAGG